MEVVPGVTVPLIGLSQLPQKEKQGGIIKAEGGSTIEILVNI